MKNILSQLISSLSSGEAVIVSNESNYTGNCAGGETIDLSYMMIEDQQARSPIVIGCY